MEIHIAQRRNGSRNEKIRIHRRADQAGYNLVLCMWQGALRTYIPSRGYFVPSTSPWPPWGSMGHRESSPHNHHRGVRLALSPLLFLYALDACHGDVAALLEDQRFLGRLHRFEIIVQKFGSRIYSQISQCTFTAFTSKN